MGSRYWHKAEETTNVFQGRQGFLRWQAGKESPCITPGPLFPTQQFPTRSTPPSSTFWIPTSANRTKSHPRGKSSRTPISTSNRTPAPAVWARYSVISSSPNGDSSVSSFIRPSPLLRKFCPHSLREKPLVIVSLSSFSTGLTFLPRSRNLGGWRPFLSSPSNVTASGDF